MRMDESQTVVGLPGDDNQLWRVDDLPQVRMRVEWVNTQGQTIRVQVVDPVGGAALLLDLRRPRRQRQTVLQIRSDIPERRNRRRVVGFQNRWDPDLTSSSKPFPPRN